MMWIRFFSFLALLLTSFALHSETRPSDTIKLMELVFEEREPGIEPYSTRILLNESMMRLDDGRDDSDFILFDRTTQQIHSFNHEDQTHLIINPEATNNLDFKIQFSTTQSILADAPKVSGQSVIEHRFYADSQLCKTSMNVPGLLPDAQRALIEYDTRLMHQNLTTLGNIPAAMRNSCYMANNYLQATAYLESGFPLQVTDQQGRQKKLMGFSEVAKHREVLSTPQGYRVYYASMPEQSGQ